MTSPTQLMQTAVEAARRGMAAGQSPFGCAIASGDKMVAAHNTVVAETDITAHAEMNALRQACREVGSIFLDGAVVATTCEPCPMCMAALHWARVQTVYYGASIQDAQDAGFNELPIPAREIIHLGQSPVELHGGLLTQECRELFQRWLADENRVPY